MPDDDQDLVRHLRHEWRNAFNEGIEIRDKKGYVDSEARSKCERIEVDLNRKTDLLIAAQDAKIKAIAERSSRMPGGMDGGMWMPPPTLGQRIVDSDEFKSCGFQGKFSIQIAVKARIRGEAKGTTPLSHPAGVGGVSGTPVASGVVTSGIAPTAMAPGTIVSGGTIQIIPPTGAYPIFPQRMGIIPQMFPP